MIVVVNAQTMAISEYTVDAVDVVAFDGGLYFVQADSLATLDESIVDTAIVETGMLALGADEKKYVSGFKTTLSGDSTTEARTSIELDGDTLTLGPYELPGRSGPASFVRQWRLAGGIKTDSLSLRFDGKDGAAWKLSGLTVLTELL